LVLKCDKCGADVEELGCIGCRRKIQAYVCQSCGNKVINPSYHVE